MCVHRLTPSTWLHQLIQCQKEATMAESLWGKASVAEAEFTTQQQALSLKYGNNVLFGATTSPMKRCR